mgnify:FL=1
MTLKKSTAVTILNGIVNPLFMCSFLPIVEGKPGLGFQGLTGFWGQLILAIGIAQFVGFLPLFGKAIETCVEFFGFDRNTPGARICGTVVGATLLFCIIGLFEVAFQSGVGVIDGVPFFSRWVRLVVGGWAFVVVGGLLFDPFVAAIAAKVTGE